MDTTPNRWITTSLILGFFAVITLAAGRQGTATASNVVVTNSVTQPVPIKITGSTTPVNINESTHGKDGIEISRNISVNLNVTDGYVYIPAFPGERFVITNVYVFEFANNADFLEGGYLRIADAHNNLVAGTIFPAQTSTFGASSVSFVNGPCLFYLDPGQTLFFDAYRTNTEPVTVYLTLTGYRVAYP